MIQTHRKHTCLGKIRNHSDVTWEIDAWKRVRAFARSRFPNTHTHTKQQNKASLTTWITSYIRRKRVNSECVISKRKNSNNTHTQIKHNNEKIQKYGGDDDGVEDGKETRKYMKKKI